MLLVESIVVWLIVGFLAGLLAKAIVPGSAEKPSGFWGTAILGIVGAIVGGFIYFMVSGGNRSFTTGLDFMSIVWATVGAIVVVFIERAIASRRVV